MSSITCTQCGKVNGHGTTGSNWICGDCRVAPDKPSGIEVHTDRDPHKSGSDQLHR